MNRLRSAREPIHFVWIWFVLSLGMAVASPLVDPQITQWSGSLALTAGALEGGRRDTRVPRALLEVFGTEARVGTTGMDDQPVVLLSPPS